MGRWWMMARTIKKYTNRKFYDTVEKKYTTLSKIKNLVKSGEEIKVVDNETGEDLTAITLTQLILEHERGRVDLGKIPVLLHDLFKKGKTSTLDLIEKSFHTTVGILSMTKERAEELVHTLRKEKKITREEGERLLKEFTKKAEGVMVALEERIENAVKKVLKRLNIPTEKDIERIRTEMKKLRQEIQDIKKRS
jgi:polyhydroxyalkanoate synthesis repressor PhaR